MHNILQLQLKEKSVNNVRISCTTRPAGSIPPGKM